jgi:acetyltransferase-like isoleucine patch superfamily enzyme
MVAETRTATLRYERPTRARASAGLEVGSLRVSGALFERMSADTETSRPPLVRRALSLASEQLGRGRLCEADILYQQVLEADPGNAEATAALGELRGLPTGATPPVQPRPLHRRLARRVVRPALESAAQRPRVWKYRVLSTCPRLSGSPVALQPVLFVGPGAVVLGEHVQFGWKRSPLFYTGYCYVEAARPEAVIELGDRTEFNNNSMIKSEGAGIRVGRDGLFGAHVEIFDSNFHDLDPAHRVDGRPRMAPVDIGDNVFVGMSVKILKGVTIGADSVIGAGAVVSCSIPGGVIAAGNPARVLREL